MRAKVFIVAALVAVASILGGSALGKSPPPPPPKPAPPKPAPAPPKPAPPAPKPAPPPPPPPVDPNQQLINRNGMPSFQDQHSTGTVTRIDPSQVPKGGTGDWPGSPTQRRFYTRNAVYPTCFTATGAYSGPSDWTGYAHLNGWMSWCSNGFWITYATGSAYGTVSGWYSISQQGAPYWSGGCIGGCQSISLKAYMNWHWAPPLTFSNNGTSWLTQTATPYGGYST